MHRKKILVVDDNKSMQLMLKTSLMEQGYRIITASDGLEAIEEAKKIIPDLVLLDMKLPKLNGLEVLKELKEISNDLVVIMISAYGNIKSSVSAMKAGAYDYITKPFNYEELSLVIKKALEAQNLNIKVKKLQQKLSEYKKTDFVLGESLKIQKVLKQIEIIAPTNMGIIIYGGSGTGKEVFANLIHKRSLRKNKSFIPVDCGAIPNSLFESELFGYEKGAFTGANTHKKGDFELADKGTLFLDEISNLSIVGQAKLLRVLEEKKIKRVGSTKFRSIDVRILVATNVDLSELVSEGKFREDLYHRLNEFSITLPLLNDRKTDIPILAIEFLQKANIEFEKNVIDFSSKAMKYLLNHNWTGNVRELKHTIKRAILVEESDFVTVSSLKAEIAEKLNKNNHEKLQNIYQEIFRKGVTLHEIKNSICNTAEKEIIKLVLLKVKYNKTRAAQILGIDRKTLYLKIKTLNID